MSESVVIGAGIGGLSAAITLASRGLPVRVLEAAPGPGGKADIVEIDGVRIDTGPSVLTLPEVFDGIFKSAGTSLADEVELVAAEPAFRYHYPDGLVLDLHHSVEETEASIERTLGPEAARELRDFLTYARQIWEAGAPSFVFGDTPSVGTLLRLGVTRFKDVLRIDSMRAMYTAIKNRIDNPYLRSLFARYATYNGSNALSAPATLNCIAWVEIGLGGYGVVGGIHALILAMVRVAKRLGVRFEYERPVRGIHIEGGRVVGVKTDDGEVSTDHIVANADAAHVARDLLPPTAREWASDTTPSMSGFNMILRARRRSAPRPGHAVLFPDDYEAEFRDIFERDRPPETPTVYVSAPCTCHRLDGWPDAEPLFIMANTPAEPREGTRPRSVAETLERTVLERLTAHGLIDATDDIVWRRTPEDLAARFAGSRGAIYGAASNSMFAAFQRPPNRVPRIPGLYLASGSAHPGGGMPLCALSGQRAAQHLALDVGCV